MSLQIIRYNDIGIILKSFIPFSSLFIEIFYYPRLFIFTSFFIVGYLELEIYYFVVKDTSDYSHLSLSQRKQISCSLNNEKQNTKKTF